MATPILEYTPPYTLPPFVAPQLPLPGYMIYWPSVDELVATGGNLTALDQQQIWRLPDNAMVVVSISGRGESMWKRTLDATNPATDANAGIIKPSSYDASLRPYVLNRISGY